jgi:hypothetical protein
MSKIGQFVKLSTLTAVLVIAIMGMTAQTGQASEEIEPGDGGFCPTSSLDSCGVNPKTGTYFRLP